MAALRESEPTICFSAKLLPAQASESCTLTLPKNASAKLPSRGKTMIEGTINAFPFRAALEPDGRRSHRLKVNETMLTGAGVDPADTVTVEISRAGEEAEMRVPADLREALSAEPASLEGWEDITPLARRDWIFSITSAKQPETRRRRIEKACDMLASGKRRLCCFPGIKWMMRDNEKTCGMWLPLPKPQNAAPSRSAGKKTA